MKREMEQLYKLINVKNKQLALDGGGSQDAVNDPEWAIYEGIDTIEYTDEALKYIIIGCDYDIGLIEDVLNECIDKSFILDCELVKEILDKSKQLKTYVIYANLKNKYITATIIEAASKEQAVKEMNLIYNEDCEVLISDIKEIETRSIGFFPIDKLL